MNDSVKHLIELQDVDSRIFKKSLFIEKVPLRISEVDEPLKQAGQELEKIKQNNEGLIKKKREKEKLLEETGEKIKKMKARAADIKTNKEYQAHLKEIESTEEEISRIEEDVLVIMVDLDAAIKVEKEKEKAVKLEMDKLNAFKTQLDLEVGEHKKELSALKEKRSELSRLIERDLYSLYMGLLNSGNGVAVTRAENEICLGCNMNIPPQLFVEIRKNEEIIQCPQCQRILYYPEDAANGSGG